MACSTGPPALLLPGVGLILVAAVASDAEASAAPSARCRLAAAAASSCEGKCHAALLDWAVEERKGEVPASIVKLFTTRPPLLQITRDTKLLALLFSAPASALKAGDGPGAAVDCVAAGAARDCVVGTRGSCVINSSSSCDGACAPSNRAYVLNQTASR
jgi:hypothetical protein